METTDNMRGRGRPQSPAGEAARRLAAADPHRTAQSIAVEAGVSHGLASRILAEVRREQRKAAGDGE